MALSELLVAFEQEATDVGNAKGELEAAKAAAAEAAAIVNGKQDEVSTQTSEARAAYNALLAALAEQAIAAGII